MPTITALLHTENDALRIGRCLETLYPCDEIVIIDHGSRDSTLRIAREYGAFIIHGKAGSADPAPDAVAPSDQPPNRDHALIFPSVLREWILCLDPRESLSESLAASLYAWKVHPKPANAAFSVFLREETADCWVANFAAQTRLVPRDWPRWHGRFPLTDPSAPTLEGELLRFAFP